MPCPVADTLAPTALMDAGLPAHASARAMPADVPAGARHGAGHTHGGGGGAILFWEGHAAVFGPPPVCTTFASRCRWSAIYMYLRQRRLCDFVT